MNEILSPAAKEFLHKLHRTFGLRRKQLLDLRQERLKKIRAGEKPGFLPQTKHIRDGDWRVAPAPKDLDDRRVEITGPVDRKMVINALNCGAKVFMADFEDANSPTWENCLEGQSNLFDAVRKTISLKSGEKTYELKPVTATLVVRPRGWHLEEKHFQVESENISASLFDFGLFFFHNAGELLKRGTGPYFYLPKLESHLEARLWNDVFTFAQKEVGIPHGTIRATVLIETILAACEMEEILFELKDHSAGLNAGRWDYIFSVIKKFSHSPEFILPDRIQISMTVPFMRAYSELLVRTCHKRGAHAMGGMAAFIPNRRDPEVTERALQKVTEDKQREARDGFDGTWVAHPDLVPVAMKEFDAFLGTKPNQKSRLREDVNVNPGDLIQVKIPGGRVSLEGVRTNVDVALQYIERWLSGTGAVAIHNLMEDAATAEISRAQLWQWIKHGVRLDNGTQMSADLYKDIRDKELAALKDAPKIKEAAKILDELVLGGEFVEFLTIPAYAHLP